MALNFYWRFQNSVTLSATDDYYGSGDNVATAVGSAGFSNAQARDGYSGNYVSSSYHQFDAANIVSRDAGSIAFWFRVDTGNWTENSSLFEAAYDADDFLRLQIRGTTGSGNVRFRIQRGGFGTLNLETTYSNMAVGTWYFVILRWDYSVNDAGVWVYDTSGNELNGGTGAATTASGYTSNEYPAGEFATIKIGEYTGANPSNFYVDNLFIGSAYADGATFLTKRDITSYADYAGGSNALEGAATAGALASGALTNTAPINDLTLRWSM